MPFFAISIIVQVLCAVHIIRTGRNQLWLWAVVLLSIPGCIGYFVVEVAPDIWGGRRAQQVRATAVKRLDPERELRAAQGELAVAETAANQLRVADALVELGRHAEAVPIYDAALRGVHSSDRRTQYKLASALLESGGTARAATIAADLPETGSSEGDRAEMLRARIDEALGDKAEAMTRYAELVTRFPGEEVRCRYAHLLIEAGRTSEARVLLTEVAQRAKRLTRAQRVGQRAMYDWAAAELGKL